MVNYIRAIKRPFTNTKKLIIGLLFSLPIPLVSIFTNNIARGYALNCGKTAVEGNYDLPEWGDYKRLWTNSVVATLISSIYAIPVFILLIVFARDMITDYISDRTSFISGLLQNPLSVIDNYGVEVLLIPLLFVVISYFTPIAVLNWIISRKFKSAFDFANIFKKVLTRKYFIAWVILMVVGQGVGLISLKLFPSTTLSSLNEAKSNFLGLFLPVVVFSIIISIIQFIQNMFSFTVYGNVIEELNITEDSVSTSPV